jgi:hypothetical protein
LPRSATFAAAIGLFALTSSNVAVADSSPAAPAGAPITAAQMQAEAREYYDSEITASLLFAVFGGVTAATGGLALTQSGDFARGFGFSSLIAGGTTILGAVGYALAVEIRGAHYTGLASTDLVRFRQEEAEHIGGTSDRFWLYLGSELLISAAGLGASIYGVATKNDLWRGIGLGAAIQGVGLFVIDVPGSARATKYYETVRRFDPGVGVSIGGSGRPWAATISQAF